LQPFIGRTEDMSATLVDLVGLRNTIFITSILSSYLQNLMFQLIFTFSPYQEHITKHSLTRSSPDGE